MSYEYLMNKGGRVLSENVNERPFWLSWFQDSLERLKAENIGLSEVQLAEKIKVPRATLNRLYREKSSKPNLETLLKVALATSNNANLESALNSFETGLGTTIQQAISVGLDVIHRDFSDRELENKLKDPNLFITYILSKTEAGIETVTLESILGKDARHAIEELISLNLIERNIDTVKAKSTKNLTRSFEHIKTHLITYASFYRPEHVGKNRNYVQSQTELLNDEGLKALQNTHREFHQKIRQIFGNENFRGKTPAFSVAFCDTFTNYKYDELGKK